ncbi:MAG: DegV family protein [Anaerolineae bacterium]|nr:DegV family protein [Anaerolineae bacterium]
MIKVVTDSTSDISPDVAAKFGITVVPMLVNIDGVMHEDGVNLTHETFYANLPHYKDVPKTAANSPGTMADAYRSTGADQVISIHIARKVSGVCNAADVAAMDVKDEGDNSIDVRVVDSATMTVGLGWQALAAAELAQRGATLDEILRELETLRNKIRLVAMADTLKYLRKGGRVSALNATVGELLQVKLMIELKDGNISMFDRVRTRGRGLERVVDEVRKTAAESGGLKKMALIYSGGNMQNDIAMIRSRLSDLAPFDPADDVLVTPIIGTHFGPLGIGIVMLAP